MSKWEQVTLGPVLVECPACHAVVPEPSRRAHADWHATTPGIRHPRRKVTPDLLAQVANVYRANRPSGKPTTAVREHFDLAESTASLYVKRARDAGLDMGDR
jgi:hypothetical protein